MARTQKDDESRYEALKRAVADLPLIRRGSVVRRYMPCGRAGCCCQAPHPTLHGPYFQWTRKVRGKTVTVRITETEAKLLAEWIKNGRRLAKLVGEMERVSYRLTERVLRALQDTGGRSRQLHSSGKPSVRGPPLGPSTQSAPK